MGSEPVLASIIVSVAGFLAVWYMHGVNRRLEKHGKQIDDLFLVVKDMAVAMARESIGRPEYEARMQRIEQQLQNLAVELERSKRGWTRTR